MLRSSIGAGIVGWIALQALVGCGDTRGSDRGAPGSQGAGDSGATSGGAGGGGGTAGDGMSGGGDEPNGGTTTQAGADQGGAPAMPEGGSAGAQPGGSAGQGGSVAVDITPPGNVTLPADGTYNLLSAFSCADVGNVEAGASVYYELSTDGSTPTEPTPGASPQLAASGQICGINQNGPTKLRVRQVDAAGNLGPVSLHQYDFDTTPPVICTAQAQPGSVAYVDLPLHLRIHAETNGAASIDVQGVGTVPLRDDGTLGDATAGDGVYELDYTIPAGGDVPNATLTAHFTDAAGNPAADFVVAKKLFVDRSATNVAVDVLTDSVWTAAGSPYLVTAPTTLHAGLTLQPGVVVIFKNAATLTALEEFSALGTVSQPIVLHRAHVVLDGEKLLQTFDPADESYVTGPRFDYVEMRDGRLQFLAETFDAAGAYITRSSIGELRGDPAHAMSYGVYVARSWIGKIYDRMLLTESRITNSYLDDVSVSGYTENGELFSNQIHRLEIDRWSPSFVLSHNNITQLGLSRPTQATDDAEFHQNNLGGPGVAIALVVSSGNPDEPPVDASANYWGATATAQMSSLGSSANISAISDFYDDPEQTRVDYAGWLLSPAAAGPDWVRNDVVVADECSGGNGGSGGGSGSGGDGGSGGGSGSGGDGGSGGNGGSGAAQLLGACNNLPAKFCEEITGPPSQQTSVQSSCTSTWQSTCPTSNLLGTCTFVHGAAAQGLTGVLRYYQGGIATAQQLKESCEAGLFGTWTAP